MAKLSPLETGAGNLEIEQGISDFAYSERVDRGISGNEGCDELAPGIKRVRGITAERLAKELAKIEVKSN